MSESPDHDLDARLAAGRVRRQRRDRISKAIIVLAFVGLVASALLFDEDAATAIAIAVVNLLLVGAQLIDGWGDEAEMRRLTRAGAAGFVVTIGALLVANAVELSRDTPVSSATPLMVGALVFLLASTLGRSADDNIDWDDPSTWGWKSE